MPRQTYTPEDVLEFRAPTDDFLCSLSANTYGIEFLHFKIIDYETKRKIFEVGKNCPPKNGSAQPPVDFSKPFDESMYRKIRYEFSEDVLRLPTIMTSLEFSVGPKEVPSFRMIERHYFRDELVKSFDFTFGFCIPGSTNSWDAIYSVPPLDDDIITQMVDCPYATTSDSFYFVDDELIMHNKAEYKYIVEDRAQAKRSYYSDDEEDEDEDAKAGAKTSGRDAKGHKSGAKGSKEKKWSKEEDYD